MLRVHHGIPFLRKQPPLVFREVIVLLEERISESAHRVMRIEAIGLRTATALVATVGDPGVWHGISICGTPSGCGPT
ncbi:hypothetical protein ACG33_11580 [Steroidobacter denitrificans]|uniref:Uncharacterized protein n=1 Tax=Steroidobacter denitrificans TaxID=465721 RepID=A0A127FBD7_STEDE|nr:hypothetical protein [Steroidobacter denitrificans]AMN47727.1 hypothetical protein ACG33_11580 [Steroidobacter denitrificans]